MKVNHVSTMEQFDHFLKMSEIDLLSDSEIPFIGITPKIKKTDVHIKPCTWMYTAILFTVAKKWKQHKCPSTFGKDKMWYTHTNGITVLSSKKKYVRY